MGVIDANVSYSSYSYEYDKGRKEKCHTVCKANNCFKDEDYCTQHKK